MYPRNAASPPEISVGSLVSTTDGSLATTGASVRVKSGGSWAAGAGTLNCDATSGIWSYVPTQGETNASHFIVAVYRSGHVSIERTVVTTVSDVAGYAGLDWSQVRAASTTVTLSGTTIKTATDIEVDTQDIQSRLPAALSGGRIDASVGAYQAGLAPLSAASTASAVWDALIASYTVSGSFGARVVRTDSASAGNGLKITASGHAAAVVHDCEPDSIPEDAFLSGAFSARVLATDAAAEVATATRTELAVELGRIDVTVGSRLATSVYTPPPSAATNAGAVRSELAVELARIDATVGSRAAASDVATLLSRLGAFTGSGVNTVLGLLKAIMSKAAATPSDVGGTFSATTDSIEAIRDAQQAGTGDASQATLVQVQGTVDAIAASLSGTPIEVVGRVADGGSITLYAGDDMRVRSGTEISVTITDVGGVIYSRLDTIGIANLAFGASRPSQPAGAIDGTVAALSQAGAGAAQTVTLDIEITDGGERLAYADNYVWQIVSSQVQGNEYDTYTEIEGSLAVRRRVAVPVHA